MVKTNKTQFCQHKGISARISVRGGAWTLEVLLVISGTRVPETGDKTPVFAHGC
jgi:hypothetical protein